MTGTRSPDVSFSINSRDGEGVVHDVKTYVMCCLGDKGAIPPEHVIVHGEAQRSWDVERAAAPDLPP